MFYYNKANYFLTQKCEFDKYFKAKTIIQFGLHLPFYIPFKNKTHVTYNVNKEVLNHFGFFSYRHNEVIYDGSYNSSPVNQPINRTRVEMTYVSKDYISEEQCEDEAFLTDIFDSLIGKLNNLITAYIIATKDTSVSKIKLEELDPIIVFQLVDVRKYDVLYQGLFHLSFNKLENHKDQLSNLETDKVMGYIDTVGLDLNPFTYSTELLVSAIKYHKSGNYRQSAIEIQTSIEVFLTSIYKELLHAEKLDNETINKKIEDIKFRNMVEHQFHKRIGGSFDTRDKSSVVGTWYEKTYLLRIQVVHNGYIPDKHECELSLEAAQNLMNYIVDLAHESSNKKKYPSLSHFLIKSHKSMTK